MTKERDREAAYLIKDYVDPRDDTVEYDPPTPWSLSRVTHPTTNPHVVVELGAGLGVVGFAIAEGLQKYREHSRRMSPEQGYILSNAMSLPDVVILTDLEDVCDNLLNPNLSHKASFWSTRTNVQTAILPCQWQGGSSPNQYGIVPPDHKRNCGTSIKVAVMPLAWGSMEHTESFIGTLMPYQNTGATFTVICSDLVRTLLINFPGSDKFEGLLSSPSGTTLTHSSSLNVSFAIPVWHVSVVHRNVM